MAKRPWGALQVWVSLLKRAFRWTFIASATTSQPMEVYMRKATIGISAAISLLFIGAFDADAAHSHHPNVFGRDNGLSAML